MIFVIRSRSEGYRGPPCGWTRALEKAERFYDHEIATRTCRSIAEHHYLTDCDVFCVSSWGGS